MNHYQLNFMHPDLGELTCPTFTDATQFKLFCKMVQSALALKENLTTYDAQELFVHIPYNVLVESIIVSKVNDLTLADYAKTVAQKINK